MRGLTAVKWGVHDNMHSDLVGANILVNRYLCKYH